MKILECSELQEMTVILAVVADNACQGSPMGINGVPESLQTCIPDD
jgi:hypothetical protein